ncbi:MAG: SDR family oxidoreductase [Candidatus Eremiobacteraeota bacterium]|nr:SDR family oxidoreductase [Candidatus Eremiobacteraeota bacterium]MCW5869096.1 SDR family oxidoreductase [Candidatus Eremiobacteraeota bacterium]
MLSGKTILVTGASMGIGKAIAREAAYQGARVIVAARHRQPLEECLAGLSGSGHELRQLDVADNTSVKQLVESLDQLDGLVNNAGILGPIGLLGEISLAEFEETLAINFMGAVRMIRGCLPLLLKSPRGKIVNLSGGGAATPFPRYSAYACSKVALVRLTENLAREYEQLDINIVAPGFVLTRLHEQTRAAGPDKAGPGYFADTEKQTQSGGVAPSVPAELIRFLLSDASDGLSGRFLSAPWDPWREPEFLEKLRADPHLGTLRRIDNKGFQSK